MWAKKVEKTRPERCLVEKEAFHVKQSSFNGLFAALAAVSGVRCGATVCGVAKKRGEAREGRAFLNSCREGRGESPRGAFCVSRETIVI